ncbi:unnamed protein product [Pleuronectes platessa]|uniref:Protein kinase domain-containing protein n=1 Tax=Pleuronectes platessa TaxID=8262 RepID=A0A9N7UGT9_PLEPL|nr:unnamed protein product [Pleuronectes platessa]
MSSWRTLEDSSAASVSLTAPDAQDCPHNPQQLFFLFGPGLFRGRRLRNNRLVHEPQDQRDCGFENHEGHRVNMLKVISELDADLNNMVKFHEVFQHLGQTCLVFERLDISLYDLLKQREWEHHPLHEIRPVAKQLFVALDALKGLWVLHTDIKPDNVMFVNMKDQPLRVKLIDFGLAMMTSKVRRGMKIQPCGYRAPEISLGLPFSEAVDVWGDQMKDMVTVLGLPQHHLLDAGWYSEQFFIEEEGEDSPSWRLMTADEYNAVNNVKTEEKESFIRQLNSLNGLIHIHPKLGAAEMEDRMAFVSLLEGLLHLDGDERLSPRQALKLPFISMSHLREDFHSRDYRTTCQEAMRVCPTEDSVHCSTSDSGYSGSMDQDFSDSVEALDSPSATSELSWCSDKTIVSHTICSPTFNDTSEELYKGSDLQINSSATWVWSPIRFYDTIEELSKGSDLKSSPRDTLVWSAIRDDDTSEELSKGSDLQIHSSTTWVWSPI